MVYREVFPSNNSKYLAALNNIDTDKDITDITVYNTEGFSIINTIKKVPYGIGGTRCAISGDGKYLVGCTFNKRKGMILYDISTGKKVWTNKDYTKIQRLAFSKDNSSIIVCTDYGSIYYISVETGETIKFICGNKIFENVYGEDIILNGKTVKLGDINIQIHKACLISIATKTNVVISLVGSGLYAYDYKGSLLWENFPSGILHFLKLSYDEVKDTIYGIAPEAIISFRASDGVVIDRFEFEAVRSGFSSLFIREGKSVLGADKKIYNLDNGRITLSNEMTDFDIGVTVESYVEKSVKCYGDEVQVEISTYDNNMLRTVPKKLHELYSEYRKIVVPYLEIYSIEDAMRMTKETGVEELGYFIFGYGEDCGYLMCALDTNSIKEYFVTTKEIHNPIEVNRSNDILSALLMDIEWDNKYK
ncbi:MAG: hypothetical protein IKK33_05785 [Lachnospiraceae bacterium]|nr:hypothetical protein [Lachnospiraceae bacterium]